MSWFARVNVPVGEDEFRALQRDAEREYRDARDHARYLLRRALGLDGGLTVQESAEAITQAVLLVRVLLGALPTDARERFPGVYRQAQAFLDRYGPPGLDKEGEP